MAYNNGKTKAMDYENQSLTSQLGSKVSRLKSLAFDIEQDSREHNSLLDSMGGDFDSAGGFLGGSGQRLHGVITAGRQNRRVFCYTVFGLVAVVLFFYYVLSRISWSSHQPPAPSQTQL